MKNVLKKVKTTFKPAAVILLLLTLINMNAGIKSDKVDLTKDKELRNEVFNQILSNSELFNEFMIDLMNNRQSMNWMMQNGNMMSAIFDEDNLQYIMHHDTYMSNHMFNHMMMAAQNDSTLRKEWNDMMNNRNRMGGMGMENMPGGNQKE